MSKIVFPPSAIRTKFNFKLALALALALEFFYLEGVPPPWCKKFQCQSQCQIKIKFRPYRRRREKKWRATVGNVQKGP